MPDPRLIASLGLLGGVTQIAAIGLLHFAVASDEGGAFHAPRSDDPRKRRRRDDETLLMIGAL